MTYFTVCCGYASHYHNTVTIEADTLDAALEKAIEQAGDNPHWKSVDQASQTFVEALSEQGLAGVHEHLLGETPKSAPSNSNRHHAFSLQTPQKSWLSKPAPLS